MLRQYIQLFIIATALLWTGVFLFLFFIDPLSAPVTTIILFYVNIFFALMGAWMIAVFMFRKKIVPDELFVLYREAVLTVRIAVFCSTAMTGALILLSLNLFTTPITLGFFITLLLVFWFTAP